MAPLIGELRARPHDEFDVVKVGPDGDVSSFGLLLNRAWANKVATYQQVQLEAGERIEIRHRFVPAPVPPWETVAVYEPLPRS